MTKQIDKITALKNIEKICTKENYSFYGFCNKNGEDIEWGNGVIGTYLKLKCNKCGREWNTTNYHSFMRGRGCKNCNILKRTQKQKLNIDIVLSKIEHKCREKKYIFLGFCDRNGETCEYKNARTYLKLKCETCGNIWNTTNYGNFVCKNNGCPQCGKHKILSNTEAIEKISNKCKELDFTFYGFCDKNGEDIEWNGAKTYLKLKCNKCNHTWSSTNADRFFNITKGCPNCQKSILENEIESLLKENKILFNYQKYFDWLGLQSLDFYIPSKNIAIECQGRQHFKPSELFGGEEGFKLTIERDERKRNLCEENGVKLLYFSNLHIKYPYQVYENMNDILEIIKGC